MKSHLRIVLLAFITALGMKGQNVSYSTLKDDPHDIKGLCISLDPFYADAWGTNQNLGFGIRADMYFKRLFSINFDLRRAYLDINAKEPVDGSLPKPQDPLKKHLYLEIGGQLSFWDRTKDKDLKVVLSSSSSSNGRYTTTHTNYIMVPGTIRKVKQVRGGVIPLRTAMDITDGKEDGKYFKSTLTGDTTSFTYGDFAKTVDGSATYGGNSMMNMVMVYAGLSAKRITNLLIETGGETKGHDFIYDFYLDFLYAPVINFSNVYTYGGKEWDLTSSEMKKTGWRFGLSYRRSARSFMSYRMEFGSRPGFTGNSGILSPNFYLMVAWGWSIPIKIKALNSNS